MFYTSAYGTGAALLGLTAQGGEIKAQEIYFTREMQNHHGGVVLVNGYLYGFNNSILSCLKFATGETMWRHRSVGKGRSPTPTAICTCWAKTTSSAWPRRRRARYKETGRFKIADKGLPSWAHPVVSGGACTSETRTRSRPTTSAHIDHDDQRRARGARRAC